MKIKNISEEELGYLIGLFEGDGYSFYNAKDRHYYTEFYLNSIRDKSIIEFLLEIIQKLGLKPQIYLDKRFNCKRIRIYSRDLYELIKEDNYTENKDFKIGFISGFIDSDGYYNKKKFTLAIINTDMGALKRAEGYLKDLNIDSSIRKKSMNATCKNQAYNLYISVKFIRLNPLSRKAKL